MEARSETKSEARRHRQQSPDDPRRAGQRRQGSLRYCQLNSRRNKNRESDKINRRSSSDQLTIALTQIASSHTANLDFITAR